ncbi:MAG: flagellar protein FlaG [Methylocystaceae bacterium]
MKVGDTTGVNVSPVSQTSKMAVDDVKKQISVAAQASADIKQSQKMTAEEVSKNLEIMNKAMEILNYRLRFRIDEDSEQLQVKVIEKDSEKVIREIPPQYILDMIDKLKDTVGMLLDKIV